MDVRVTEHYIPPVITTGTGPKDSEYSDKTEKTQKTQKETITEKGLITTEKKEAPKVMMDEKEMQNFFYLLIGFDIKLENENTLRGDRINSLA